uniref:Putative secreted protein n=1 Tax=Ixodes ricinus TaxID=34613 RepID=A0A6B0U8L1_IXORI
MHFTSWYICYRSYPVFTAFTIIASILGGCAEQFTLQESTKTRGWHFAKRRLQTLAEALCRRSDHRRWCVPRVVFCRTAFLCSLQCGGRQRICTVVCARGRCSSC